MPAKNLEDVRTTILRSKAYEVRPLCVVRYVRRLDLSNKHEAVYWEIFRRAARSAEWVAQVSLATLAHEIAGDVSTVTRALARLADLGLLRRQNPGRVAGNPMRQAVTLYEIRFPPEMLRELLATPDRRHPRAHGDMNPAIPSSEPTTAASEPLPAPASAPDTLAEPDPLDPMPELRRRYGGLKAITAALAAKLSPGETERLERHRQSARRGVLEPFEADPDTRLDALELAFLRTRPAAARPAPVVPPVSRPIMPSPLLLAEFRARLTSAVGPARADALFDEAVWSLTRGSFSREPCRAKAMNAIVKLIGAQRWTRPNRMPPNFRAARPETCRAA